MSEVTIESLHSDYMEAVKSGQRLRAYLAETEAKLPAAELEIERLRDNSSIHWREIDLGRIKELESKLASVEKERDELCNLVREIVDAYGIVDKWFQLNWKGTGGWLERAKALL